MHVICNNDGFPDVVFRYLGGLGVFMEFPSLNIKYAFKEHAGVLSRFKEPNPKHRDFIVKESLVWVGIEGVAAIA